MAGGDDAPGETITIMRIAVKAKAVARARKLEAARRLIGALPAPRRAELGKAGAELVAALLVGRWYWSPVNELPGRHRVARKLAKQGWLVLWPEHRKGLVATLSQAAAEEIGVEVDEVPVVYFRTLAPTRAFPFPVTIDVLQEYDRWVVRKGTGEDRKHKRFYMMPRTQAIADPPYPDPKPEANHAPKYARGAIVTRGQRRPLPPPAKPGALPTPAEARKILGAVVADLTRARSSKKKKPRPGRGAKA